MPVRATVIGGVGGLDAAAAGGAQLLVSADRDEAGELIAADVARELSPRFGPDCVAPWMPAAEGTFEEERLEGLLADLAQTTERIRT